jgi:hypothetical protein
MSKSSVGLGGTADGGRTDTGRSLGGDDDGDDGDGGLNGVSSGCAMDALFNEDLGLSTPPNLRNPGEGGVKTVSSVRAIDTGSYA